MTHVEDENTKLSARLVHNCLESPDPDNSLSDDSSLLPHSQKAYGPTLHNVKAKRISLVTPNANIKLNQDRKSEGEIDDNQLKSRNEALKKNGR